jgi:prolyl 4-hydroxylase
LSIIFLYIGSQQRLLSVLHSYLPEQLRVYLPAAVWEATTFTNSDGPLSPKNLLKACGNHQYTTEIISLDPLLIYINNFTSTQEAEELIELG